MKTVPFGRTGLQVSVLGFGGSPIGYLQTERDRAGNILNYLLDHGVNLIDTAASYKESETVIAETIGQRRDQFILVSKCGTGLPDIAASAWSAENITQTIDRSLRRLKTEAIDVVFLHSCDLNTLKRGEALNALTAAHKAGKVRFPGYSGDNEAAAYAAALPEIYVIETSVNIVDQVNIDKVLPVTREHHVGVLAKRPIANAAWKQMSQQADVFKGYIQPYADRFATMNLDPQSLGFAGKPAEVWPEIALRFTLSQSGVNCAIIGTTNLANARANLAAVEKGPLPAEIVAKIRQTFGQKSAGESWIGLT
jgi:aryl-alcohol dehydrogenase-like predicted oxidoreductase